jgi:transcription-repair coupling factor (superfamily II helicase)
VTALHAPLGALAPLLVHEPSFPQLLGGHAATVAVPEHVRAGWLAGAVHLTTRRPLLVAVPTANEAERLAHDLRKLLDPTSVELFPAWETLPFERVSPATETMGRRLRVMWRLREGGPVPAGEAAGPASCPAVVVAPVRALIQRLGPHVGEVEPVVLRPGQVVDRDELVERLVRSGYRREYQVEARGELAVRGSIVDVYPSDADHPIRIDLWGDEVDRLQAFHMADQRTTADLEEAWVFPARELLPTDDVRARAAGLVGAEPWGREQWERLSEAQLFDGMESWLPWVTPAETLLPDLLPDGALVVLVEPRRMRDRARELLDEEAALAEALSKTWGVADDRDLPRLSLDFDRLLAHTGADAWTVLQTPDSPDTPVVTGSTLEQPPGGDGASFARSLRRLVSDGYRVVVAGDGLGSARRLADVLADQDVHGPRRLGEADGRDAGWITGADLARPGIVFTVAPLDRGFVLPESKLAVVAEADVTGRRRVHRRSRRGSQKRTTDLGLEPGDFVVHDVHGVARYEGMVARSIGGVERDYLLLAYKGADKLYVPTDQVSTVRKYTGGESPALSKMGGAEWTRTKAKVRSAVREVAQELVVLYQRRITTPGHAFPADTPWQQQMEDDFPYEETPDQQRAIDEVKADMEAQPPMDRLVCGDVGFGKTEIAVRAVFKAVQDGKQAAVLCPTTLLANQHGVTFRDRYAGYPVRVEVLSRFLSPKEQAEVVAGVKAGEVDVVIGTHRLLSEDVEFKDLGLLVVDEEQRFGVTHKERIKQMRAAVDVLTMTATPIPRTLEMSLTGIRDMSLVATPPEERQPILTYVGEYDDRAVAESIRRELLREGQVFYVHNRVADIDAVAAEIRDLVPEARVAIAHGQMDESALERVVLDFADREFDVLVCTTIIESGIDMPSVNTLVVRRADMLGLAQLYQIRGRVGRSGQRAYAYLFHPRDRVLSEEAYERLKTIGEFTDLGSGFKIAMRDLEIRGAGSLLGETQSGHIAAVGFDLYCQMVTEAVAELKGEAPVEIPEITLDVPVDAHLPRAYVERDDLRMEAYRRLAEVTSVTDVADIRAEWEDRFGPPPPPAEALLEVGLLRAEAFRLGLTEVAVARGQARFAPLPLKQSQQMRLKRLAPKAIVKSDDSIVVPVRMPASWESAPPDARLQLIRGLVTLLQELVPAEPVPATAGAGAR